MVVHIPVFDDLDSDRLSEHPLTRKKKRNMSRKERSKKLEQVRLGKLPIRGKAASTKFAVRMGKAQQVTNQNKVQDKVVEELLQEQAPLQIEPGQTGRKVTQMKLTLKITTVNKEAQTDKVITSDSAAQTDSPTYVLPQPGTTREFLELVRPLFPSPVICHGRLTAMISTMTRVLFCSRGFSLLDQTTH